MNYTLISSLNHCRSEISSTTEESNEEKQTEETKVHQKSSREGKNLFTRYIRCLIVCLIEWKRGV